MTTVPPGLLPAGAHCLSHPARKGGLFCLHLAKVGDFRLGLRLESPCGGTEQGGAETGPLPVSPASLRGKPKPGASRQLPLGAGTAGEMAPVCL